MENDGKKESYQEVAARRIKEYQTLASVVAESADEIRRQLNSGVPLEIVAGDLRDFYGIDFKSDRAVHDALYKYKKNVKSNGESSPLPSTARTSTSSKSTKPKKSSKSNPPEKLAKPDDAEVSDEILKIEELLRERLPDSVRPFVEIRDGGLITHFEKGTIHTAEIREFKTRIRRLCDGNLI